MGVERDLGPCARHLETRGEYVTSWPVAMPARPIFVFGSDIYATVSCFRVHLPCLLHTEYLHSQS